MKLLILAMGSSIIVILLSTITVVSRKSKKHKPVKKNNVSGSNNRFDDFHEDEMEYKTEALASQSKDVPNKMNFTGDNKIDFGKIPMLDKKKDRNDSIESTGIPAIDTLNKGIEATQILSEPKEAAVYAELEYLENGNTKKFRMTENIINIGRDPMHCELVVSADSYMGRNHAAIYFKNNKFFITDMNSKNGTFVNGERIEGFREIEDGCILKIARTEMKFKCCIWNEKG